MGRKARVIALGDKALDLALLAVDDLPETEILKLSYEEPAMRLLVLFVCQPHQDRIPWWWPLWRRLLLIKHQAGVRWLVPLQPLTKNDLSTWYDGFSGDMCRQLNRDRLIEALLDLFEDGRSCIRYRPVSKRLVELIQPKQA
jgi:hypothetical protein